jgi:hypothetical protein
LQVAAEFASCCALQVSEAALVKTEGLADEALRLDGRLEDSLKRSIANCANRILEGQILEKS